MKTMIIKRLESSFHAFKKTINRFVQSHKDTCKMMNSGKIYVSKKNIFDLLDEDNDEKINRLVEEEVVKEFEANDFSPRIRRCSK